MGMLERWRKVQVELSEIFIQSHLSGMEKKELKMFQRKIEHEYFLNQLNIFKFLHKN
jgi:hypothetical protein